MFVFCVPVAPSGGGLVQIKENSRAAEVTDDRLVLEENSWIALAASKDPAPVRAGVAADAAGARAFVGTAGAGLRVAICLQQVRTNKNSHATSEQGNRSESQQATRAIPLAQQK
jgi:hypothetical protein